MKRTHIGHSKSAELYDASIKHSRIARPVQHNDLATVMLARFDIHVKACRYM